MMGHAVSRKLALVVALGVLLLGHVCALPADDHPHPVGATETVVAAVHGDGLHAASCDGTLPGPVADAPPALPTSLHPGLGSVTARNPGPVPVELSFPPHLLKPPLLI
jgi:hypothetical protein